MPNTCRDRTCAVGKLAHSLNTASIDRARILEQIGVRDDVELALYAVRGGCRDG